MEKGPYIDSRDDFAKRAEILYLNNPNRTRFVVKYRNCDGNLVLKVTNDKVCLKYRTEQTQDVKKLDKLNNVLMRHICSK